MYTSRTRMTGFSGMDVDSMVSQLMRVESLKLDKIKRSVINLQWKQEAFRSVATRLREFDTKHIDILNESSSMLRSSTYSNFTTSVKNASGTDATAISVATRTDTRPGNYSVSVISKAQSATYVGDKVTAQSGTSDGTQIAEDLHRLTNGGGTFSFSATFGSQSATITVDDTAIMAARASVAVEQGVNLEDLDASDPSVLERAINDRLQDAFGKEFVPGSDPRDLADGTAQTQSKLRVKIDDVNGLQFEATGAIRFTIRGAVGDTNFMDITGIKNGATNDPRNQTLGDIFPSDNALWGGSDKKTIILGQTMKGNELVDIKVEMSPDQTVSQFMSAINAQSVDTGTRVSFDALSSTFKFESVATGLNAKVGLEDNDGVLKELFGIDGSARQFQSGQDAIAVITDERGQERILQSASNVITDADATGLVITVNNTTTEPIEIRVDRNDNATFDHIKAFIDSYNELLQTLRSDVNTARARSDKYTFYEPLLDEEKQALTEKQVEEMEAKAKEGILNRDPIVNKIIQQMQTQMTAGVPLPGGGKISLFDIGIDTSSDWTRGGELVIRDEAKLRAAIADFPENVETLFKQSSGITMMDVRQSQSNGETGMLNQKLENEGIAYRMQTIIELALNSSSGTIAIHAGIVGTPSVGNNAMAKMIDERNDRITRMLELLEKKENDYYAKFAAMEAAMVKGENQMSSLMAQMGM